MTHPNNSATPNGDPGSVGAEAIQRVIAWLDLVRDDDAENDTIVKSARSNVECVLTKSDLRTTIERLYAERDELRASRDAYKADAEALLAISKAAADALDKAAPAGAASAKASRYPWKDASAWARWAATDENGLVAFFENKPVLIDGVWVNRLANVGRVEAAHGDIAETTDFRDSLEPRPNGTEGASTAADGGVE